jgi:hypothetical protein
MGHGVQTLLGVKAAGLDETMRKVLPDYMTMGQTGMGDHGRHAQHMSQPRNSIAMQGAEGPQGYIDMGGMFTILKVRDTLANYTDPGWYNQPSGSVAGPASAEELRNNGINAE